VLACLAVGCVSEYHGEFTGSIESRDRSIAPHGVYEISGVSSRWPKDSRIGLYGISLGKTGGCLAIVVDRAAVLQRGRPSNDTVRGVYLVAGGAGEAWDLFLKQGAADGDHLAGAHRLRGSFDIQRWKSNVDYRIELAMRSDGPEEYQVNGTVAEGDRWEFQPQKWLAMLAFQTGMAGEGD
jgi:hypothetical protein